MNIVNFDTSLVPLNIVNFDTSLVPLLSQCGVTIPEFTYTMPPLGACDNISFTVIPQNAVGNGSDATEQYSVVTNSKFLQQFT